ncbi:TonB-dependent receptor [Balneolales bacterium ANBcel1]|nr:TonB-dependent receptor [Balneolales bacterium ANBcel1]
MPATHYARFQVLVIACLICCSLPAFSLAQEVQLRGIITDADDGQPVEGAHILLTDEDGTFSRGAATDRNGLYRLARIPEGTYRIRISYIGYHTFEETIEIPADEASLLFNARIQADRTMLDELTITVPNQAARLSGGHQRVAPVDLQRVVTPAAGGDIASYLQVLPGVVAAGDRGGQLFVRGGTSSENLVLVDGMTIYQPFHIVGYFSAFPQELLANADFYAGGFETRYSGRISSVLDVRMRDGNFQKATGSGSISPFLAEIFAEGPVSEGRSSWIGSFRRSHIEHTDELFMSEEQPVHFESQFLKYTHLSDAGTRCSGMAMHTYDRGRMDQASGDSFWWRNLVTGVGCTHITTDPDIYLDFNTGISHLSNGMGGTPASDLTSSITKINTDLNINQHVGSVRLTYGLNTHMKWLRYDISEMFHIPDDDLEIFLGLGGHVEASIPLGDFNLRPGVAANFYTGGYSPSLEPRFRLAWQPFGSERQELNASVGYYRQLVTGVTDLRDVGSAFLAWMPVPEDRQMSSIHYLIGWQQRFANGLQFSAEAYHKNMSNIPVTVWSTTATFTTDLEYADGNVYGADVRLEYGNQWFYGFVGYGYSWTKYRSGQDHFMEWFGTPVQSYHPAHDRRHQLNTSLSTDIADYTFTVGWQMGTGLPFTRHMGFDSMLPFDQGLPNVIGQYGTPRAILDKPFQGRTPVFHRLDVSVNRSFVIGSATTDIQVGAINTYGQNNLFYYDLFTQRRIDQLPFAPYASMRIKF